MRTRTVLCPAQPGRDLQEEMVINIQKVRGERRCGWLRLLDSGTNWILTNIILVIKCKGLYYPWWRRSSGVNKISKGNCINFQNVDYENQVFFELFWEVWLTSCFYSPTRMVKRKKKKAQSTLRYNNKSNILLLFYSSLFWICNIIPPFVIKNCGS